MLKSICVQSSSGWSVDHDESDINFLPSPVGGQTPNICMQGVSVSHIILTRRFDCNVPPIRLHFSDY